MKHSLRHCLLLVFFIKLFFCPLYSQNTPSASIEQEIGERIAAAKALEKVSEKIAELKATLIYVNEELPKPHTLEGRCFYELGQAFRGQFKLDSASLYYHKAKVVFDSTEAWSDVGQTYLRLAVLEYYEDDYEEMISVLDGSQNFCLGKLDSENEFWGTLYNYFGVGYFYLGQYERAIDYGKKELKFYVERLDSLNLIKVYNNLASLYERKGDYGRAIEYYSHAERLTLSSTEIDVGDLITLYSNLGTCWYRQKEYEVSKKYGAKELLLLEENDHKKKPASYISTYNNISLPYLESGSYDSALVFLRKAEYLHDFYRIEKNRSLTYHNIGYVYLNMKQYELARKYLEQTLSLYRSTPKNSSYNSVHGKLLRHFGRLETEQKNHQQALVYYQSSLKTLLDANMSDDYFVHPELVNFSYPVDIFKTLRAKGRSLYELSKTEQNSLRYLESAFETFALNVQVIDSMRNLYETNSKVFWNEEVKPFYEEAIEVALTLFELKDDEIYKEKAFEFAEKSKATLLTEALRESFAISAANIAQDILQKEKDLKIDITFYQKQVFRLKQKVTSSADSSQIHYWESVIFAKKEEYQELLEQIENDYPEYFQLKHKKSELSLKEIQTKLAQGQGIMAYFYGKKNIYSFAISRQSIQINQLAIDHSLTELIQSFNQNLSDQKLIVDASLSFDFFKQFVDESHELYQILFSSASILNDNDIIQLLIIPDGPLGYLSFELLVKNPLLENARVDYSALDYLLKNMRIRYEYSVNLAWNPLPSRKRRGKFLGFAPSYQEDQLLATTRDIQESCDLDAYDSFKGLSNNKEEVNGIASLLNGKAYLAEEASEEIFKQEGENYQILHFAMHAFLNHCNPLYSGLAFSPVKEAIATAHSKGLIQNNLSENDGLLYAYEIYNMRLNAELVSLSACNTGLGKLAEGEGIMSLARAFKYAGAPNILMSLWQADDATTKQIMLNIYRRLDKGQPKDLALQQAKLDFLTNNSRKHPFYWGSFVLIGDAKPLLLSKNRQLTYLLIVSGIIFLVVMLGYLYRKNLRVS